MLKPIAFVSHSFLKKDKKVCDWFLKILKDFFIVDTAGKPEPEYIIKKVLPKIDKAEYFVALLCKRACVLDDCEPERSKYISSPWIYSELGYALAKSKKILIFVEEGVHHHGMYPMDFEVITVNPERVEEHYDNVKEYIQKTIEKYSKIKEAKSFVVTKLIKEITAYKDGYGLIEIVVDGRVLNDNFKRYSDAGFGLSDSKGRTIFFDRLSKPEDRKKRHLKNTIHFTPISDNLKSSKVILEKSPKRRIQFVIIPSSQLKAGDIIKYGIGVSAKDIFNDYKHDSHEFASHEINDDTEELKLILKLEVGMNLIEKPKLTVYDNKGNEMKGFDTTHKESRTTYFDIYEWELQEKQVNIGYTYNINWKRKK